MRLPLQWQTRPEPITESGHAPGIESADVEAGTGEGTEMLTAADRGVAQVEATLRIQHTGTVHQLQGVLALAGAIRDLMRCHRIKVLTLQGLAAIHLTARRHQATVLLLTRVTHCTALHSMEPLRAIHRPCPAPERLDHTASGMARPACQGPVRLDIQATPEARQVHQAMVLRLLAMDRHQVILVVLLGLAHPHLATVHPGIQAAHQAMDLLLATQEFRFLSTVFPHRDIQLHLQAILADLLDTLEVRPAKGCPCPGQDLEHRQALKHLLSSATWVV